MSSESQGGPRLQRRRRNRVLWLALIAVFALVLIAGSWHQGSDNSPEARSDRLAQEIRCPTCAGLSVAESDAPLAVSSRDEIDRRVAAGESEQSIREYFVSRYGESALMSPKRHGASLIAWLAPIGFGIVAAVVLVLTVRKWRSAPDRPDAAPVVEAHDESVDRPKRSASGWAADRRVVVVLSIVAVVAVSVGVVANMNQRSGTDEITGGTKADSNTLLARAQQLTTEGKAVDALKTYEAVLDKDPRNVEALAYKGWLISLAGLPDDGLRSIEAAIATSPQYPDAHFFRGYILLNSKNQPAEAIPEFEAFLANNPPESMRPLVEKALADARAQAAQR